MEFQLNKNETRESKIFVGFNDPNVKITNDYFNNIFGEKRYKTLTIMCICRDFNVFSVFSIRISPRVFFQSTAYARMLSINACRLSLIGPMS